MQANALFPLPRPVSFSLSDPCLKTPLGSKASPPEGGVGRHSDAPAPANPAAFLIAATFVEIVQPGNPCLSSNDGWLAARACSTLAGALVPTFRRPERLARVFVLERSSRQSGPGCRPLPRSLRMNDAGRRAGKAVTTLCTWSSACAPSRGHLFELPTGKHQ